MLSFDFPQKCIQCGNIKTFPYSWSITSPPVMCNCVNKPKKYSLPVYHYVDGKLVFKKNKEYIIDEIGHWEFKNKRKSWNEM